MATSTRRAALYVRVSARGQTCRETKLQPLQEAAGRLGWTVVAIFRDEGISRRQGGITAGLGRSLSGLIGLLDELRSRDIDLGRPFVSVLSEEALCGQCDW